MPLKLGCCQDLWLEKTGKYYRENRVPVQQQQQRSSQTANRMHSTLKPKRAISTKNFAREAKESHLNSKTYALIEFPPVLICSCVCSPLVFGVHADFGLEQFGSFWIFSGAQLCLTSSKFVVFIAHINQKASN